MRQVFAVHHHEDKRTTLDPTVLDYLGVHFEVSLLDANICSGDEDLRDLICEIQVHTQAQNLWATVSHELIYKAHQEVPPGLRRGIHRLMALLELFDKEVEAGREAIMNQPGFSEARILDALERHFYALTVRPSDRELSLHVIRALMPLFDEDGLDAYSETLAAFVESHRTKLEDNYSQYLDDARHILMSQPESLLVFEWLEKDRYRLTETWLIGLPEALLRSLSEIWGTPVDI